MSPRRQPAPPPDLPGYTVERLLGSGGFADVYLYSQRMPQRQVAIKVLTHEATQGQSREQFAAEANLMAQLSTHSSIVTIYHADTAADGRPYLVMQYCPLPNLAERVKVRPLGVPEVLGIGVRLAGAVETAHRAGIAHRDIKPANILTTEYGRPALTDFGIAGLTGADESGGVSIPWAPPEAVEGQSAGVAGDVYSLAATLYTLLAGRSPFARPGGPNSRLDFTMRIKRDPVPPIGRTDVPASLEQLLARAMAKSPAARPATALELARALQVVEQELRLAMTDIEVPDTSWLSPAAPSPDDGSDEGRTVVRAVTEVDPTGAPPPPPPTDDEPHTVLRPVRDAWEPEDLTESTRSRRAVASDDDAAPARGRPGRRWVVAGAAAAVVVAGAIVVAGQLRGEEEPEPGPTSTIGTVVIPDVVPGPVDLRGERVSDDRVEFTWTAPDVPGELTYSWVRTDGNKVGESQPVDEAPLALESSGRVCIAVRTITEQGMVSAEPAEACVE
ncbi:Serine/threonine protein kinase [Georgenia satyanarayanai]|uniref:non-specific serine/threonine protein kinase n=1 Tax=Georgenia satyanarayanai TaxID=860221 RepID=A0A2Y8ZY08_9MICO|nr:serine/threonine-protein kinase [Georgenia satyanarayanai]PYG01636.1 serine/threonine protein kinase [Georgenia satyanarayanai]SSA36436.1 Serine/threonine protein kinase [Georgenia satyanarayanai]